MEIKKSWKIGKNVVIGERSLRKEFRKIEIGENAIFLSNSIVYSGVKIGKGMIIGHNSIIREECEIGDNFKLWNNSIIDYGCKIGNNVKIHSNVYAAQYTKIEDNVFIAPGVVIANDKYMKNALDMARKKKLQSVTIKEGCRIGINSTILPGIIVGKNSLVGAGSVVTKDVPDNSVICGNPARIIKKASNV